MRGDLIGGIFIALIVAIIVVYTVPSIEEGAIQLRADNAYNCASDPNYNATLESNSMGCGIAPLISPLYLLGGLALAIIFMLSLANPPSYAGIPGQPQY